MEEDLHLLKYNMKKIIYIIAICFYSQVAFTAGSDSSSSETVLDPLKDAKVLIKRAGKLEKKDKVDKAKNLYSKAFKQLEKAHSKDKKNPDILNYMGYTSRKSGNFEIAEKFYLQGLSLNPDHRGINEYLGELYVQTNRIDKAKERLEVLKGCNCDEFKDLELIIKTRGTKIY